MSSDRLQRLKASQADVPAHVAIIMDGNGRWAQERGLLRHHGHKAGMKSVREAVEGALQAGLEVLTLFAFSQENWQRPTDEVSLLMTLLRRYVKLEARELAENGVEVHVIGDLKRLKGPARRAIDVLTDTTRGGVKLQLVLAISYGSRAEIVEAARRLAEGAVSGRIEPGAIDEESFAAELLTSRWRDPDLLIRTSGEYRISNFMLWQLAYTELYTSPVLWPDFSREDLFEAIIDYQRRERRFGRVSV